MDINKDLMAASSTPIVLAILAEGDSYGYAILKRVAQLSGGHLQWTDGMLYPVLHRLERQAPFPVTIIMVDLNGLKATNDSLGHAAGDALLRRAGEVLSKAVDKPRTAARIGGDEFAVLLPATDERQAATLMDTIQNLVELNNQFYSAAPINLSLGAATCMPGEPLENVAKRADAEMYKAKRAFYSHRRTVGAAR